MRYTITFEYEGKQYAYRDDYNYEGWDEERNADYVVTYMYTEGNYCCDCNRSDFIRCDCENGEDFPELECGYTINLVSIVDEAGRTIWPEPPVNMPPVYVQRASGLFVPVE